MTYKNAGVASFGNILIKICLLQRTEFGQPSFVDELNSKWIVVWINDISYVF